MSGLQMFHFLKPPGIWPEGGKNGGVRARGCAHCRTSGPRPGSLSQPNETPHPSRQQPFPTKSPDAYQQSILTRRAPFHGWGTPNFYRRGGPSPWPALLTAMRLCQFLCQLPARNAIAFRCTLHRNRSIRSLHRAGMRGLPTCLPIRIPPWGIPLHYSRIREKGQVEIAPREHASPDS